MEKELIGLGLVEIKIKVFGGILGVVIKKLEYKLMLEVFMILK